MQKLIGASLLLMFLATLQSKAFAAGSLNCDFKTDIVDGVTSIQINEETLTINDSVNIALEKSRVKCSHFGRQTRYDGVDAQVSEKVRYQVILKTCSADAKLEGHLIDHKQKVAAEVYCNEI